MDRTCPDCGAPLRDGAEPGRCPECLLRLGLGASSGEPARQTGPTRTTDRATEPVEEQIGPYRLLERLGEGGMGEVWLAEQSEPVRRRVALKVIKRGMDTREVVARFEAERQALALMDHPAIAKVYEAGETPRGRPYFAMEHVKGVPITEHCDRHRLTTHERLELFLEVCEGVQHAHQKAVIHRDLKPSNVLVAVQDGKALPKIIDFGVAKATAQRLTERTLFTAMGVLIGTPAYMSPEQAELTAQNVDTRTDVYSLGVMLYELLVGALPFEPQELRAAGFEAIVRKIREEPPPRPSMRLTSLGDRSTESAHRRQTSLPGLKRELTGDLDWITMRALEKDRRRRYGSPQELAADIRRHLEHEPVVASPPGAAYRVEKFVRRHRVGVGLAAAGVAVLLAFAGNQSVQARRIAAERDKVALEAETAKQVSDFLTGLFEVSDPSEARGNSITAREILDQGAGKIERELADQPLVQARLMGTMGKVYRTLGLYDEGEPLLRSALEAHRELLGKEHLETLEVLDQWATLLVGGGSADKSLPLARELLNLRQTHHSDGELGIAAAKSTLGYVEFKMAHYEEAERLMLESHAVALRELGPEHPHTMIPQNNLALLYREVGREEEAIEMERRILHVRRRVLGDDHPNTLASIQNLATGLHNLGRLEEAETLFLEAVETCRRVLGDDHLDTLVTVANQALLLKDLRKFEESEVLHREVLEAHRRLHGEDNPDMLIVMGNLGDLYTAWGRYEEGEEHLAEALERLQKVAPPGHVVTAFTMRKYGVCLTGQRRFEAAEGKLLEAYEMLHSGVGPDHRQTTRAVRSLAELYEAWGKAEQAEEWRSRLGDPSAAG